VPNLIVDSEAVIQGQLREFSRLGPDGKFYTAPEYPKPAWYEALVNACVHRSYNFRNMNVFVRMFDDKIEVESPGGFPGIVTPQNIYEIHEPRNPFLMEAMYYLRFVKCAREGTRRMRETMKSSSLPAPEFSQAVTAYDVVRVILRNNIKQRKVWIDSNVGVLIGEALFESLSEDERRALNFVAENGTIGVSQLQRLTGRSWPAAKKVLEGLAQRGVLEHHVRSEVDRDPNAHYTLRRNGPRKEK
jgi:ATP-dependent DNA helicase RecG